MQNQPQNVRAPVALDELLPGIFWTQEGWTLRREEGQTPSGTSIAGRWVLRDAQGVFQDAGRNLNDLLERHNLCIGRRLEPEEVRQQQARAARHAIPQVEMFELRKEVYGSLEGLSMRREEGTTPNGNPIGGRWVLRDIEGTFLDVDRYRSDLLERHNLRVLNPFC